MTGFLQTMLSFPTVIFTFFMCLCLILWLMSVLGVIGFEAGDIDVDADIDIDMGGDGVHAAEAMGIMSRLGLGGVPITIVISLLSLFGWIFSFLFQAILLRYITFSLLYYLLGIVGFVVSLVASVWLTAKVCKPLRVSLKSQEAVKNRHLIGQVATVRSGSVSLTHGEAVMDHAGAGLLLRIRAEENQNFKKGDKVVLLEYLEDVQAYRVISEDEFRGI